MREKNFQGDLPEVSSAVADVRLIRLQPDSSEQRLVAADPVWLVAAARKHFFVVLIDRRNLICSDNRPQFRGSA